jgi:hypothetical protein
VRLDDRIVPQHYRVVCTVVCLGKKSQARDGVGATFAQLVKMLHSASLHEVQGSAGLGESWESGVGMEAEI